VNLIDARSWSCSVNNQIIRHVSRLLLPDTQYSIYRGSKVARNISSYLGRILRNPRHSLPYPEQKCVPRLTLRYDSSRDSGYSNIADTCNYFASSVIADSKWVLLSPSSGRDGTHRRVESTRMGSALSELGKRLKPYILYTHFP
jgi:hypothetical protein